MTHTPLVTVVVPTLDAARTLEACLTSIRAQTHPRVELIVVDARSTDATPDIARAHADEVITTPPGLAAQRNVGWRRGSGELVAFIDADMVLEPGILSEAATAFAAESDAAGHGLGALVIPELAFGSGFLASCRVLEKRIYLGDPAVEAARIFPRPVLDEFGGYDEDLYRAFEDWDLPDRVRDSGYRIGRVASRVWHDEGTISLRRQFRKKLRYGNVLPAYRERRGRAPVRRLARPQLLTRLPITRHPLRSGGLVLLKTVEWSGLLSGAVVAHRLSR